MILFVFAILIPAAVHGKAHGNHGHNQGFVTDNPLHVNNEIQDLNVHFGTHFCLDLLVVDCRSHVTNGDEQVCGTDDRTYANHCEFAHAMCMFSTLSVKSHGACNSATRPPTTMMPSGSTMMPPDTTMMPSGSTMMPQDTTMMPSGSTMMPPDTTMMPSGSTMMPPDTTMMPSGSTMMPVDTTMMGTDTTMAPVDMTTQMMSTTTTQSQETVLFQQVFCKNKNLINCPTTVTLTCGSNGVMYNSGCEFSKAKCDDITLSQLDVSQCSTPVVG